MDFEQSSIHRNVNSTQSANSLQWIPGQMRVRWGSEISGISQTTEILAKQNIKYGNSAQAAWGILLDYSRISTIHGVRYMVARRMSWWERFLWICIFVGAIYTCSRLISKIWLKWETTPVIVSFSEKTTPIWEIPFPSIVLCPESRTVNGTFNFTDAYYEAIDNPNNDEYGNLSSTECRSKQKASFFGVFRFHWPIIDFQVKKDLMSVENPQYKFTFSNEYLQTLAQICDIDLVDRLKFGKTDPIDVLNTMAQLAPTVNYTMPFGLWKHRVIFPDGLFTTVFTDLGVCHQFNGMHQSEILRYSSNANLTFEGEVVRRATWSLERGYWKRDNANDTYPERVETAGARGGLFMATRGLIQDIDYLCRGSVEGFSLQLLSPGEFPAANKQYIRVPFNKDVMLLVKPSYITTSARLKSYSWRRRQCFFNDERYLKFFKAYTQNNCMFECLTNYTFSKCGCVKFSMPRTPEMPICQAYDIPCYYEAEDDLLREQFKIGLKGSSKKTRDCNCLPACTSLVYDVEISEAKFDVFKVLRAYKESYEAENPGLQMGRTSIFFKEQQFLTLQRSELYGTTDFLASSGGLLGLFLGISALSIVELLYFCTARLISNLKMRRKTQISNSTTS